MSTGTILVLLIVGGLICLGLAAYAVFSGAAQGAGAFIALAVLLLGLAWFGPWRSRKP